MADRIRLPPGAGPRIERMLRERDRLEAQRLREAELRIREIEAAVFDAVIGRDPSASWTVRRHGVVMRSLRALGRQFGADLTGIVARAAREAAELGAAHHGRAIAILGSTATGKRVAAPAGLSDLQRGELQQAIDVRTDEIGSTTGEDVARAAVRSSYLAAIAAAPVVAAVVGARVREEVGRRARTGAERAIVTEVTAGAAVGGEMARAKLVTDYPRLAPRLRKVWEATLDRRVCATCAGLHHAVVDHDRPFPGGYADAPAHARCRCTVLPFFDSWSEALAELGLLPGPRGGVQEAEELRLSSFNERAPVGFGL